MYSPLVIVPLSTKCGIIEKELVPKFRAAITSLVVDFNITAGSGTHYKKSVGMNKKGKHSYIRSVDGQRLASYMRK